MDKLDYDLQHANEPSSRGGDVELDLTRKKTPKQEQVEAIEFSKRLLNALEGKLKQHNSRHSKRIKLHQLNSVFIRGTGMYCNGSEKSITEWGLARVNLFLRISSGKIDDINLDINKIPSYNKLIDITDCFVPTDEDFERAESDIENYDLDYHFDDVDELYINNNSNCNLYFDC